jgi:hypothetical protein
MDKNTYPLLFRVFHALYLLNEKKTKIAQQPKNENPARANHSKYSPILFCENDFKITIEEKNFLFLSCIFF